MKKLLLLLILLAGNAFAAYVTIDATFTNRSLISSNFVVAGVTVTYTNAPLNNSTWIATNNPANNATNLLRFLGANYPKYFAKMTNATNVTISGIDLQFSFPGNSAAHFAFTTTNSAPTTNFHAILVPWDTQPYATNRTNDADELIYGLNKYARTNAFSETAQALTNFVALSTAQTMGNKTITNTQFRNIGMSNVVATNFSAPGAGAGSIVIGSGATASGASGLALGSTAAANAAQATAIGSASLADSVNNTALGYFSTARGANATALGEESSATTNNATAVGQAAVAAFTKSTAVGSGATTTTNNQVRLGTATETVSIPGPLSVVGAQTNSSNLFIAGNEEVFGNAQFDGGLTIAGAATTAALTASTLTATNGGTIRIGLQTSNTVFDGTNVLKGDWSAIRKDISSLANGNNIGVIFGTNYYIRLSGTVTAMPTLCGIAGGRDGLSYWVQNDLGYSLTISQDTVDPTPGNRFELYGGTAVTVPQDGWVILWYDTSASRWKVAGQWPLLATATNAVLQSVGLTNATHFDVTATNTTGGALQTKTLSPGSGISMTNEGGTNISVALNPATIPGSTAAFTYSNTFIVSGQFWTNTTGYRTRLKVAWSLLGNAVSGFPSLCMTNVTSGEYHNPTNGFVLTANDVGRTEFDLSPGDYFIATNKSSGSATATVISSWLTKEQ